MLQANIFDEPGIHVRVVSKRKGGTTATASEHIIDVDRSHPVLGNRHILHNHRDSGERDTVIAAYALDIESDWEQSGPMRQELKRIAALVDEGKLIALRCWCAPTRCHADLLRTKILEICAETRGEKHEQ